LKSFSKKPPVQREKVNGVTGKGRKNTREGRSCECVDLTRLSSLLSDIENNEDVERWRKLAQTLNDKLLRSDEIKKEMGQIRTVNRFRIPALEEANSCIQLLAPSQQQSIFSLMTKFDWLNEHIDEYNHFAKTLIQMPSACTGNIIERLDAIRYKERVKTLRLDFARQIAALSLNILEEIVELLDELSQSRKDAPHPRQLPRREKLEEISKPARQQEGENVEEVTSRSKT
jgi:hypothetical protein